jgi:hypothetical protein
MVDRPYLITVLTEEILVGFENGQVQLWHRSWRNIGMPEIF